MRSRFICILVGIGIAVFQETVKFAAGQDCSNYATISDGRRSTLKVFDQQTDTPICDDDLDINQWYRFDSYVGDRIPERQPPATVDLWHCGTQSPMYIKGTGVHPATDGDTVDAVTCANLAQGGDNCNWQGTARIHRCPAVGNKGRFYIYKLQPPDGCDLAFCAGEQPACDTDFMWNGTQCINYFPTVSGFPSFTGPHTTGTGDAMQIYFTCAFSYQRVPGDTNARFKITFLFDDIEIENLPVPYNRLPSFIRAPEDSIQNKISVDLTEYYLRGRLGKHISCQMQAYWEGNGELTAPNKSVDSFLVALQSNSSTFIFDFNKGSKQSIPFWSTVPLTCFHCYNHLGTCLSCSYSFTVNHTALAKDCAMVWNRNRAVLNVEIKSSGRGLAFEVVFRPFNADKPQNGESLWHGYTIPNLLIMTNQISSKVCSSTGDPHITTFDDMRTYNNYLDGYFSLVSAEFDDHKLEIQVQQEKCFYPKLNVACNCGIVVREFNTAYKVAYDDCGRFKSQPRTVKVIVLMSQHPPDGSEVMRNVEGNKYSIRMASGLRVEMYDYGTFFNYYIYLPAEYQGKTSALSGCGNSDGQPDNINDEYCENFRLTNDAGNYFKTAPLCDTRYFFPLPKTCNCDNSTKSPSVYCSNDEPDIQSKTDAQDPARKYLAPGGNCTNPAYISASNLDAELSDGVSSDLVLDADEVYRAVPVDLNHGVNVSFTWPTPTGKEEMEVEQYCKSQLYSSPIYNDCVNSTNIDVIVTNCKEDIKITDEYIDIRGYVEAMQHECINNLIEEQYASNSTNATSPVDISAVYNKVCPNQCSNHGTCVEATCTCDPGYVGEDCSIDKNKAPVVYGSIRNGLCDLGVRQCASVSVYGQGIYSSQNLKCRFKNLKNGSMEETNGTFVNRYEVSCPVPGVSAERLAVSKHEISLANDGTLFGNTTQYIAYDSVCMSCGEDKTCTQLANACLISERCYANGATRDTKSCVQCVPNKSSTSWTNTPVTEKLQECSRSCDYGAQLNQTVCTANNAVINSEPVLCRENSCQAVPEEKSQGVIITLSNEDLAKVMLTPTVLLSEVVTAVNGYCSDNPTECCNSVGVPEGDYLNEFTSVELCPFGSGYPKVGDTSSRVKVIVKIVVKQVQQECIQKIPQKTALGDNAYAKPEILVKAVSEAEDVMEMKLDIDILSVSKDDESNALANRPLSVTSMAIFSVIITLAPFIRF